MKSLLFRPAAFIIILLLTASYGSRENDKPLKIIVISDLNSSYGSVTYSEDVKKVVTRIAEEKPDLILCGGDMVAGQRATLTEENIRAMWNSFQSTVLQPFSDAGIPFGFTVGNHDASPSYETDRRLARNFWQANIEATGLNFIDKTNYPFYFSYVQNGVFVISWDAAGPKIDPAVYSWMSAQLRRREAKRARLRIVIGHLPLYAITESKNKTGEVNADPEAALAFFRTHDVDLYISGHQHVYYPAAKEGVRFLNMGCIGDGPRMLLGSDVKPQKSYTVIEIPRNKREDFNYTTYTPDNQVLPGSHLPDSVIGFNGVSKLDLQIKKDRTLR